MVADVTHIGHLDAILINCVIVIQCLSIDLI